MQSDFSPLIPEPPTPKWTQESPYIYHWLSIRLLVSTYLEGHFPHLSAWFSQRKILKIPNGTVIIKGENDHEIKFILSSVMMQKVCGSTVIRKWELSYEICIIRKGRCYKLKYVPPKSICQSPNSQSAVFVDGVFQVVTEAKWDYMGVQDPIQKTGGKYTWNMHAYRKSHVRTHTTRR